MTGKVTMREPRRQAEKAAPEASLPSEVVAPVPVDPADQLASFIASIPNFAVRDLGRSKIPGGPDAETFEITFGVPAKKVVVRALDVADEWDLAELAGEAGKSEQWMMMSKAAAAVVTIQQVPYFPGRAGYTRDHLRRVMRELGVVGMNAVSAVQAGMRPAASQADPVATAKN